MATKLPAAMGFGSVAIIPDATKDVEVVLTSVVIDADVTCLILPAAAQLATPAVVADRT
ncbi:uncharacterized protein METZ01_LOCUS442386 [marine metagenome]|uniref:Uncharacterized protein n=1 Tax=marine metagenome TaxID=408172 RepID=A0A382Z1Z8_9ZZZZ